MNFNNINGVWPQIKDYIDSKLGGGVSDKYKHMIYVQGMFQLDDNNNYKYTGRFMLPISGTLYSDQYAGNNYIFALKDNAVYLLGVKESSSAGYNNAYQISTILPFIECALDATSNGSNPIMVYSTYGSYGLGKLKEGWYINYMGCVYDYQGNIVE